MSLNRKKQKQSPPERDDATRFSLGRMTEPPHPDIYSNGAMSDNLSRISTDFQMTVRFRFSEIQRREVSLLLTVLNYQVCEYGATFGDYLTIEHCVNALIGNKGSAWDIKDEKERITVLGALTILSNLRGELLFIKDRLVLSDLVKEDLQQSLLITKRQYGSLKQFYNVNRFISIRAVPLETFMERRDNSERYDSYTRGYKDGGSAAPSSKTRYSSELDGEDSDKQLRFDVLDYRKYQTVLFYELRNKRKR